MKKHFKAKFLNEELAVHFGRYGTGELAIELRSKFDEPYAKCTISAEPYGCPKINHDKQIYVKDYAENEGMVEALRKAGLIRPTTFEHILGRTKVHECSLTQEAIDEAKRQGVITT